MMIMGIRFMDGMISRFKYSEMNTGITKNLIVVFYLNKGLNSYFLSRGDTQDHVQYHPFYNCIQILMMNSIFVTCLAVENKQIKKSFNHQMYMHP